MLSIRRKVGEEVRIGEAVVKVGEITAGFVNLMITAPRTTPILRRELVRNVSPCQPLRYVLVDLFAGPLPCRGTVGA
ncbi:MAG: carbon storage regulator [Planctomycetaceae bacterium]|nr:carbon storage regulator [Planctomycetaceae bacterium]